MRYKLLFLVVGILFLGCAGENKVKVSGTLTKHHKEERDYFTIKDDKTNKLYQIAKKSEIFLKNRVNHKVSMKAKILEESSSAQGVQTIASCTKCHHSIKEL